MTGKTLLVVVDMQNDFISGTLGTSEAQAIVPRVKARVEQQLAEGQEVVFTQDTHYENYMDTLEGKKLPVMHCQKGTEGWKLEDSLAAFPGKRFEKTAFGSVELARYVQTEEFDRIELLGLCTDICVIANALLMKTVLPGTPIFVRADCCAGVTPESHENALKAMQMCQVEII